MKTSKVYIHRNDEKMWEVGVSFPLSDGSEMYVMKHEASTWSEAGAWVEANYIK